MRAVTILVACLAIAGQLSCSGGGSGEGGGGLQIIEFLESGQDAIPRNRPLVFRFSAPVATPQDFPERLKIQNVQAGQGATNFSRALGIYLVTGETVTFLPQLPEKRDRTDAGLRPDASYHVFVKAGPDALLSTGGDRVATQQEFLFNTSRFFEDPVPQDPPRALRLVARDPLSDQTTDLSRLDPRPVELALLDSNDLLQGGRGIDPGAGGAPQYGTPWELELHLSEPLDPATVTGSRVQMYEIRDDALTGSTTSDPGHFGDPVSYKVPIEVELSQRPDAAGTVDVFIRVRLLQTLVDDARYRISFAGDILGLDYREAFTGRNGLTGDGQTPVGGGQPWAETGGLGYVAEFVVHDRPAITSSRELTYDPLVDGIDPETGQTALDEDLYNTSLYNPASDPGRAVGIVSDFGDGRDGDMAVTGDIITIDTGDVANPPAGPVVLVTDVDYLDQYPNKGLPPAGLRKYEAPEPMVLQLESLTVSPKSTLRIVGVNPCRLQVRGIVEINGTLDAGGGAGVDGSTSLAAAGEGGPGGFAGGLSPKGDKSCGLYGGNNCSSYDGFLNLCAGAKAKFPFALKGEGPGRGNQGGDSYPYWAQLNSNGSSGSRDNTGTGGGGGSHATQGTAGEDRINKGGAPGTAGPSCSRYGTPNSSVVGIRGQPGPTYGDREALDLFGGSGGGAGGSVGEHAFAIGAYGTSGGAGGGGGGFLEIISAGPILVSPGGRISVAGGPGGAGYLERNISPQYGTRYQSSWNTVTGAGGGGAGGTVSLVSGADIVVTGGILDARGGAGGARGTYPGLSSGGCNGGGEGGKGFIYLMDVDGNIEGLTGGAGTAGQYDNFEYGVLTIANFDLGRFGGISAITELFAMPAADPDYQPMLATDVVAHVNPGQEIRILASSAKPDPDDPRQPDLATEIGAFEVARARHAAGATTIDLTGSMEDLNPAAGVPARDAFTRLRADFQYSIGVEAAIGPYASVDRILVRFQFNG